MLQGSRYFFCAQPGVTGFSMFYPRVARCHRVVHTSFKELASRAARCYRVIVFFSRAQPGVTGFSMFFFPRAVRNDRTVMDGRRDF